MISQEIKCSMYPAIAGFVPGGQTFHLLVDERADVTWLVVDGALIATTPYPDDVNDAMRDAWAWAMP